ncbi:ABC transporter permease [Virgibacillus byunsanensis]|uniref:ABC transporter permease n=1 Tax=Virgibacillus byunsanensis TaxID=570945 RepID=A0ABW3LJE0_9BACI
MNWMYLIKRIGQMLLTLWVVATILFFIFRLMPGNPLAAYIDPTFTKEQEEQLMRQFGLDKSLMEQYLIYIGNLFKGELGQSFFYKDSVSSIMMNVLPNTIYLMLFSFVIAYVVGILFGVLFAWYRGTKFEAIGLVATLITRSAPQFWVGMVLLAIFSFNFNWFPSGGVSGAGSEFATEWEKLTSLDFYKHMALPSITLIIYLLGLPLLLMRSNMLDVLGDTFVEMAKMRGLGKYRIMFKYGARNAALPVLTAMAVGIGYTIGGNVIIESVFSWPGIGRLLVNAVTASDYPLAQGAFLVIAGFMIFMNFIADLLYGLLDPKVSVGGGK